MDTTSEELNSTSSSQLEEDSHTSSQKKSIVHSQDCTFSFFKFPYSHHKVKADLQKTISALEEPKTAKKDKLELLNRLVEFSESVGDLSSAIPLVQFIK